MRQLLRASCILVAAAATTAAAPGAQKVQTVKAAVGPLYTGIWYHDGGPIELEHIRAAGARIARIYIRWSSVAPSGPEPPVGFQPRDPADPNYSWQLYDNEIRAVSDAGLEPMMFIVDAPAWAEGAAAPSGTWPGSYKPSPAALADFAAAAATRYGGDFSVDGVPLPRVRYWGVWNEPNLSAYLNPQIVNGIPFAPSWYRAMLNASADAIHAVRADNVVIGGETAPFWTSGQPQTTPIGFMEKVLCVSEKEVLNKVTHKVETIYTSACKQRAKFDVWAHHPYTEGGPTTRAGVHGDVSLGDLGDMRAVLNAAILTKHVVSEQNVRFWVTEFSWDTKPPDPKGVPPQLEARWVSQALYQAWKAGVSLFMWADIRDHPFPSSFAQSGLYFTPVESDIASDTPKPALSAFRFPFVALPEAKNTTFLWGRTPTSTVGNVLIERKSGTKWKLVKRLEANRYGIFKARIDEPAKTTYLRARLADGSDQSVPFSLKTPKTTWTGCPFGTCV